MKTETKKFVIDELDLYFCPICKKYHAANLQQIGKVIWHICGSQQVRAKAIELAAREHPPISNV
jgi:hypothetical protein